MELQRDTETETVHVDNRLFFWVRCEFICVTHVAPSEKINKQLKEKKNCSAIERNVRLENKEHIEER